MSEKGTKSEKIPITKQTVGGVTGAVIGGMVAGPVGALAGGIAGAMVGNSSAEGKEPIKKAFHTLRSAGSSGATALRKVAHDRGVAPRGKKKPVERSASLKPGAPPKKKSSKAAKGKVKKKASANSQRKR